MNVKEMLPIIFGVLKNPKVIGTTVVMILVIAFANFIINYTKKNKPSIEKPTAVPTPQVPSEPKADISESDV